MWLSDKALDWFKISQTTFGDLRAEVAALKAERDALKSELISVKVNSDWFRVKVNQLEAERAQLLEKVYNIRVGAPEIVRHADLSNVRLEDFNFDDIGDAKAKEIGYPIYGDNR